MPYPPNGVARDYESSNGARGNGARARLLGYHLSGVAVIVALLGAPATAVASPSAVDQYTQHLPTANGGSAAGAGAASAAPVARPGLLPHRTLAALSGPDGALLAQIATARDLGAPASGSGKRLGSTSRGFVTVAADTVGGVPSLALIGALVAITAAGAWDRRRRSAADRL
jgi:hypothetical protein